MKAPTDLQILNQIYETYYDKFKSFSKEAPDRAAKIYVPIDCKLVAKRLRVDPDIVFGRLYYHLEKKYGYSQKDGARVHFFSLHIAGDTHCINFPLLSSVVAGLRQESRKSSIATTISTLALAVAFASLSVSLYDVVKANNEVSQERAAGKVETQ